MHRALMMFPLLACQSRTELLIGVATDIKAPTGLDSVQLVVTNASTMVEVQNTSWPITGIPQMPYNLPGSYGIYSDGDGTQLDIELLGQKGGATVVSRHSLVSLVEGETLFYRIGVTAMCVGHAGCGADESCVEGTCQPVHVDSHLLPKFDAMLVTHVSCMSHASYIDTGTGLPMPPTDDASSCPASMCLEGTCLQPPHAAGPDGGVVLVDGPRIDGLPRDAPPGPDAFLGVEQ